MHIYGLFSSAAIASLLTTLSASDRALAAGPKMPITETPPI